MNARREKSPGLKILWVWTLGTAAILVANVVRTRVRDMEQLSAAGQHDQTREPVPVDMIPGSDEGMTLENKS